MTSLDDRRRPRDAFTFKPVEKENVHTMRLITQMRKSVRVYCEQVDKLIEICLCGPKGEPWDPGPSSDKEHSGHKSMVKIRRGAAEELAVITKIGASCPALCYHGSRQRSCARESPRACAAPAPRLLNDHSPWHCAVHQRTRCWASST